MLDFKSLTKEQTHSLIFGIITFLSVLFALMLFGSNCQIKLENKLLQSDLKKKVKELDNQIKRNEHQVKLYTDSLNIIKKQRDAKIQELTDLKTQLNNTKIYYGNKVKNARSLSPDSTVALLKGYLSKKSSN